MDIKFEGIDDWNRPVFKATNHNCRFGSTCTLFNWDEPEEKVVEYFKNHINELEYFGCSFNCEPHGGNLKDTILNIIE